MIALIEANWPLFVAALLIGLAAAWLIFVATRRAKVTRAADSSGKDVLDEGAAPSQRNQALIDAPPASVGAVSGASAPPPIAPVATGGAAAALGGAGAAVEANVADKPAEIDAQQQAQAKPGASGPGDLDRIKGIGPKLRSRLAELGVTSVAQIAAWDDTDIERVDAQLDRFSGRIRRDDWVGQARLLESGDMDAYRARFGNS